MKYCEEFAALLDPYVDGELPLEEAARVRAHLAVCGGCRAYVQAALAIRDAFPDAEETEVPEGFAEGVMAAVRANAAPRRRSRAEDPAAAGGVLCRGGAGYLRPAPSAGQYGGEHPGGGCGGDCRRRDCP